MVREEMRRENSRSAHASSTQTRHDCGHSSRSKFMKKDKVHRGNKSARCKDPFRSFIEDTTIGGIIGEAFLCLTNSDVEL